MKIFPTLLFLLLTIQVDRTPNNCDGEKASQRWHLKKYGYVKMINETMKETLLKVMMDNWNK